MQTHRRDDGPAQPKCRTVRLGLVADRDCGIDRVGRGAGQDRSVVEQYRCCAVVIVVVETLADQRPACIDRRREIGLIHDRDVTELARGWHPVVTPKAAGMSARPSCSAQSSVAADPATSGSGAFERQRGFAAPRITRRGCADGRGRR